jgi:hypothetical protein
MGAPKKHGEIDSYLYRVWCGIKQRCLNPNCKNYHRYGGRGITLHPAWQHDYAEFASYVRRTIGDKPSNKVSLDRADNDKGYEPGNLRWATAKEQAWNRSKVRILAHRGESMPMAEWCRAEGMPKSTLWNRKRRGYTDSEAIDAEVQGHIMLTFSGKTQNLSQWAKELNINMLTLYGRVILRNWSVEEAFTTKPRILVPRRLTYMGDTLSASQWAKKLGIPQSRIYRRKAEGWSDIDALTKPARESKPTQ